MLSVHVSQAPTHRHRRFPLQLGPAVFERGTVEPDDQDAQMPQVDCRNIRVSRVSCAVLLYGAIELDFARLLTMSRLRVISSYNSRLCRRVMTTERSYVGVPDALKVLATNLQGCGVGPANRRPPWHPWPVSPHLPLRSVNPCQNGDRLLS